VFELPWTPKWEIPGSSMWCLAAKAAFAGTASMTSVLEQLVGATTQDRLPIHAPSVDVAAHAARALALRGEPACWFTDIAPAGYLGRQRIHLALKFCPQCMDHWFHSAVFQVAGLDTCPWHGCRLHERCPHCSRAIDPLGPEPWQCAACHRMFAPEPADWLNDFKRQPGHSGVLHRNLLRSEWFDCEADQDADGWICHRQEGLERMEQQGYVQGFLYDHWHTLIAFEEACTLWDTLLADHRECAAEEPMAVSGGQYNVVEFKCPVAASAFSAFGWLGVRSQLAGEWQRHQCRDFGADYGALARTPTRLRKALVRDLTRVALLDALNVFGRVATVGRWRTRWDGPTLLPPWSSGDRNELQDVIHLKATVSFSALLKATEAAAKGCVRFQAGSS
jgi:hypothetical protein